MSRTPNATPISGGTAQPVTPEQFVEGQIREHFETSGTILSITMPDNHNWWSLRGTDIRVRATVASRISKEVAGRIAKVSE